MSQSVVYVCTDANKAAVNAALAAYYGDAPGSQNCSVGLCPSNVNPVGATPTAWGGANAVDAAHATALKDWPGGTIPTPAAPWSNYGLDTASAHVAGAAMSVQVTADSSDASPSTNFASLLASMNLQKVQVAV